MATKPTITITFKQLSRTLIQRSERGTAILLLNDDTGSEAAIQAGLTAEALAANAEALAESETATEEEKEAANLQAEEAADKAKEAQALTGIITRVYKTVADIDESLYTEDNTALIKNCLSYAPYEVVVISGKSTNFSYFAKAITAARKTGWIAFAGSKEPQADLASWIKSMDKQGYTYKAVGTQKGVDNKQYVYFNQDVIDSDKNSITAENYLSSLLGILAGCNISRGCTNFLCTGLSEVTEAPDIDTAVREGQLVLSNEANGVRIVAGINSLVTLNGNTATEDMQYIETVEAMNLIMDDIRDEFKNTYQGSFKNKYKYQLLFIGAVNDYFSGLADEDVLDSEFSNRAEIDVEEQRQAWLKTGKSEAADWSDDKVKKMTFKRSVFVACDIKILNCMENLKFTVTIE